MASDDPLAMRQRLSQALQDYYHILTQMPHVQPGIMQVPPPEGFPGVNAPALRALNKNEEAIDFIRHLPCLSTKSALTISSQSIDFSSGGTCQEWQEKLISTPGYVIWFAEAITRDGRYLLLDTKHGRSVHQLEVFPVLWPLYAVL